MPLLSDSIALLIFTLVIIVVLELVALGRKSPLQTEEKNLDDFKGIDYDLEFYNAFPIDGGILDKVVKRGTRRAAVFLIDFIFALSYAFLFINYDLFSLKKVDSDGAVAMTILLLLTTIYFFLPVLLMKEYHEIVKADISPKSFDMHIYAVASLVIGVAITVQVGANYYGQVLLLNLGYWLNTILGSVLMLLTILLVTMFRSMHFNMVREEYVNSVEQAKDSQESASAVTIE